jgi:hypothetical protein
MQTYDPHRSTEDLRQANQRLDNFWVLIISTAMAVAAFTIIYLMFFVSTPG